MGEIFICRACRSQMRRRKTPSRQLISRSSSTITTKLPTTIGGHIPLQSTRCMSQAMPSYGATQTSNIPLPPQTPTPRSPQSQSTPLLQLSSTSVSLYWDTVPPSDSQLQVADTFFQPSRHSPIKLWSASKFRTLPITSVEPEVAFLGRSNVGKSSLLNAIMGTTEKGKEMCWTSAHPGRTREMNAFGIGGTKGGESKIVLLDMPGYGKASRAEWGTEIVKYLKGRKQLRRTFLLIDALHGLKDHDHDLLRLLRHSAIPHQVILSKVDRVLFSSKSQAKTAMKKPNSNTLVFAANIEGLQRRLSDLRMVIQPDARTEGPGALGEILTSSAETRLERNSQRLGVNAVRWAIMTAAGLGERHLGS